VKRLVVEAPAKVNLTLRVLRRREDGFHELDTVFQAIDLCDTLEVEPAADLVLTTDHPELAVDATNLIWRAASALRDEFGVREGARIHLTKRIPLEAGLGGGSSDAAATLLACARMWGLDLDVRGLEPLACRLGADVPFFLHGKTARGTGRGDRITPLKAFGDFPLLLGIPPFGVATAKVFKRASEWLTLPSNGVNFPALFGHKWRQPNDLALLGNDLEEVVFRCRQELRRFRDEVLQAGASLALLSGSGSTVFAVFESAASSDAAIAQLSGRFAGWSLASSRTLDRGVRIRAG
jgi:4-diphosphocytidyl-2-C-methyl-D-erythritol kinase